MIVNQYPLISIITVSYNAINTIEMTIKSVVSQIYTNIEYIIVDGGSTDGTVEMIKKYQDKITVWISEPDKGIYDAMNKGLFLKTGTFVFFLNSGDLLMSPSIIYLVSSKMINSNEVYYGDVMMKPNDGNFFIYGGKFDRFRLAIENICHQSIFYPSNVIDGMKYNLKYKLLSDWEFNMDLYAKCKFNYISSIISIYDLNGVSTTLSDEVFNVNKKMIVYKKLGTSSFLYLLFYLFYLKLFNIKSTKYSSSKWKIKD